jgi:hypothetical protein
MVIVAVYHIGMVLPFVQPVQHGYLKSQEPFRIVVVTIHAFLVQQSGNIHQVQIKAQHVAFLFPHVKVVPLVPQPHAGLVHNIKFMRFKEAGLIGRDHYFGDTSCLELIFGQGAHNIT